jgi:hypothetical protein
MLRETSEKTDAERPARKLPWRGMAAAAAVLLVAASFALAPVRSAAADFLRVFRVQKVQTIAIDSQQLDSIGKALEAGRGHIDLKSMGEVWIDGGSREPTTVSLADARKAVDFAVKLPSGIGTPTITLQAAQSYKFKLHVAAINDALRYYGSTKVLPDSVDGRVFEVKVPAILLASYGETSGAAASTDPDIAPVTSGVFAGQAHSPELVVPDGVDAAQIRDVLLGLPFVPQSVRDQLASVNDWQSTLLIPDFGGKAHDVTIDGVPAVVMSPDGAVRGARVQAGGGDIPAHLATVVFNDAGVIRAIGGSIDETRAIELARSCMR